MCIILVKIHPAHLYSFYDNLVEKYHICKQIYNTISKSQIACVTKILVVQMCLSLNHLTEHFLILGCPSLSWVKILDCHLTRVVITLLVVVSSSSVITFSLVTWHSRMIIIIRLHMLFICRLETTGRPRDFYRLYILNVWAGRRHFPYTNVTATWRGKHHCQWVERLYRGGDGYIHIRWAIAAFLYYTRFLLPAPPWMLVLFFFENQ